MISQVKKKDFLPKNDQNWHFWSIWARPCRLFRCPVGGSVGGCGARAVSRFTLFYFVCRAGFMQLCMLQNYHSGVCSIPYFFLLSLVIIYLLSTSLSNLKRFKQDSSPELITFLQKCFFDIYSDSPLSQFQQLFNNFNEGI